MIYPWSGDADHALRMASVAAQAQALSAPASASSRRGAITWLTSAALRVAECARSGRHPA
jgi:hypothetical protein